MQLSLYLLHWSTNIIFDVFDTYVDIVAPVLLMLSTHDVVSAATYDVVTDNTIDFVTDAAEDYRWIHIYFRMEKLIGPFLISVLLPLILLTGL